jgi:hypothetical protein
MGATMRLNMTVGDAVIHATAAGSILSTVAGWLPPAAALLAVVLYTLQILEHKTVRDWFARRRLRKIARMKAKLVKLELDHKLYPPQPPRSDDLGPSG